MTDLWKSWAASALTSNKTRTCDRAGIYGLDGNVWGQEGNLELSPKEVQTVIAALNGAGGGTIIFDGIKYIVLRTDGEVLMAKAQNRGFTVAKGGGFILIGLYDDHNTIVPGNNCKRVCQVKDDLVNLGY